MRKPVYHTPSLLKNFASPQVQHERGERHRRVAAAAAPRRRQYTAPPPAESHAIVNAYTLAFFDRYLRGAVARDGWLAENHYGDAVVLEAKKG